MLSIEPYPLPQIALLNRYARSGAYTDCFRTEIDGSVTLAEYVDAFYTTPLFKLERIILKWAISRPSSDQQAQQLADGSIDNFAAWYVEDRGENQILMSDYKHRTRSWLMVSPYNGEAKATTHLFFGSAVIPRHNAENDTKSFGPGFSMLIEFHKIYSVLLLYSAKSRLIRRHLNHG